jgi:hypothetical protein
MKNHQDGLGTVRMGWVRMENKHLDHGLGLGVTKIHDPRSWVTKILYWKKFLTAVPYKFNVFNF